ncbi:coenzyme PQQ synthesis protein E [Nitrospira sp.]|nr:coenzyme PQQ synthesis protein E [Nitrospira sp.]
MDTPHTLIAELTYRCPLACAYCSNPRSYSGGKPLPTEVWRRVLREAEALGVVQLHLTGGEPLLRDDLEALIEEACTLDLYINLITSGIPLDRDRLVHLRDCGLDAVQLSLQDTDPAAADRMAGIAVHARKLEAARWVRELEIPLTINVVLHRGNLSRVAEIIELAARLGASRLELANTQYLGWALTNRASLLPSREQLDDARSAAAAARARFEGAMEIIFVTPDYYADVPRACMDGWGRRYMVVAPDGMVLPCHAAHTIPGLPMERVTERSLGDIWEGSPLFNMFRGEAWMPDPCRSCDRRTTDYGGCRCQAYHLTGHAASTDPACRWSPFHTMVQSARQEAWRPLEPIVLHPRLMKNTP